MLTNYQCDSAQNTNRLDFTINIFEYNKLKASTLTLPVTNRKA